MDLEEIVEQLKQVSDTPRLDARLLMAHANGNLEEMIQRRLKHEPVSKIIGQRGFWKTDFMTSSDVLDPRPDTETMIEAVLQSFPDKQLPYRILDIGTGSGCILYSLLDEYPKAAGIGIDKSEAALAVAEKNRRERNATLLKRDFNQSDWIRDLGTFDIIVSNPPYIPTAAIDSLAPDVRDYDPIMALDGGIDGLDAYRALAERVPALLKANGLIFWEIGQGQAPDVMTIAEERGLKCIRTVTDFGGIERILVLQK